MFESLYKTDSIKHKVGAAFVGPDKLEHGKATLIAKYEKEPGSDGQDVRLYCTAMPADFYSVEALTGRNSCNEPVDSFTLSTGSGELEWAIETAKKIAGGMVSFG